MSGFTPIKRSWRKLPPNPAAWLNRQHSLFRGPSSRYTVVFTPGEGLPNNIFDPQAVALQSSQNASGSVGARIGRYGLCRHYENYLEHGDAYNWTTGSINDVDAAMTFFAVVKLSSASDSSGFFGLMDNANQPIITMQNHDTNGSGFWYRAGSSASETAYTGIDISDDEWHILVGRKQSDASGGQITAWLDTPDTKVDGGSITSNMQSGGFARGWVIGGQYRGSVNGYIDGDYALCGAVMRDWSDAEVASFLANPFQVFKDRTIWLPAEVAAAAAAQGWYAVPRIWTRQPPLGTRVIGR